MTWKGWEDWNPNAPPAEPPAPRRRQKYNARKVVVGGIKFDSQGEADRYVALRACEQAGIIRGLQLQVTFALTAPGPFNLTVYVGRYRADFVYQVVASGRVVVEDFKGMRTAVYRRSKAHFESQYGIRILESGKKRNGAIDDGNEFDPLRASANPAGEHLDSGARQPAE